MAFPKLDLEFAAKSTQPKLVDKNEAEALEQHILQRISRRAYALYEKSGYQDGHAEEHWRQAESEVLKREIDVRESGSWMSFSTTIPNTSSENVNIYVNPIRVIVRAEKNGLTPEAQSRELLLVADVTTELDPPTATASLKDGKLTLLLKKRHPATATTIFRGAAARHGKR